MLAAEYRHRESVGSERASDAVGVHRDADLVRPEPGRRERRVVAEKPGSFPLVRYRFFEYRPETSLNDIVTWSVPVVSTGAVIAIDSPPRSSPPPAARVSTEAVMANGTSVGRYRLGRASGATQAHESRRLWDRGSVSVPACSLDASARHGRLRLPPPVRESRPLVSRGVRAGSGDVGRYPSGRPLLRARVSLRRGDPSTVPRRLRHSGPPLVTRWSGRDARSHGERTTLLRVRGDRVTPSRGRRFATVRRRRAPTHGSHQK